MSKLSPQPSNFRMSPKSNTLSKQTLSFLRSFIKDNTKFGGQSEELAEIENWIENQLKVK